MWGVALATAIALVVLLPVSISSAGEVTTLVSVRAQAFEGGSVVDEATWSFTTDKADEGMAGSYELLGPVSLVGAKVGLLATVEGLSVKFVGDPVVSVAFAVTAGALPTNFTFTSAKLTFPVLDTDVVGVASAGVTVTDLDSNGAWIQGVFPGVKAYQARYYTPAGVVFANLVDPVSAGADDSAVSRERKGATAIPVPVSGMDAEFSFILSPNDMGSGTSSFNISGTSSWIPLPPAVWGGLGMMGLLAIRHIRRRLTH